MGIRNNKVDEMSGESAKEGKYFLKMKFCTYIYFNGLKNQVKNLSYYKITFSFRNFFS